MPANHTPFEPESSLKLLVRSGWLLAVVLALWVGRGWLSTDMSLFGDEAFYFLESRYPALAYSDLPPLTAWLVGLGTALFGDTYFGVRSFFLLLASLIPLLIAALALQFRSSAEAVADARMAGLLSVALPIHLSLGLFALPDVPLNVLWLAGVLAMARACRPDRGVGAWLVLGLILGLGMLTHYRYGVLLPALLGFVLSSPQRRRLLRSPGPWLALGVVLVALWPQLSFNANHGYSAVSFQLIERHPWRFDMAGMRLPLIDLVLLTPVMAVFLVLALIRLFGQRRENTLASLLLWTGGSPMVVFWLTAGFTDTERVSFHWTLCGWLTLCAGLPLVLSKIRDHWSPAAVRRILAAALVIGLAPGLLLVGYLSWISRHSDYQPTLWLPDNLVGWRQIAERSDYWLAREPGLERLLADNFMLAAELRFELGRPVPALSHPLNAKHGRATQLALWELDEAAARASARPALLAVEMTALPLGERPAWVRRLCELFGQSRVLEEVVLYGGRKRFLLLAVAEPDRQGCDLPAVWYIDEPAPRQAVTGDLVVTGWAFEDYLGVARVEIWHNESFAVAAEYGLSRPDVVPFFGAVVSPDHPRVGFSATLDTRGWPAGEHHLSLRVRERDGAVRRSQSRTVVVSK